MKQLDVKENNGRHRGAYRREGGPGAYIWESLERARRRRDRALRMTEGASPAEAEICLRALEAAYAVIDETLWG